MESLYKKKSLQFSGFSRDMKKKELLESRKILRHQRLSVLRSITEESKQEQESCIPKLGVKTTGIPTRADMLKKWKEEKLLKQQRQQEIKKPPFKFGAALKVTNPSVQICGSKSKVSQTSKPVSTTLKTSQISKIETVSQKSVATKSSQLKNTQSVKSSSLKPSQKESASTLSTTAQGKKSVLQQSTFKPVSSCLRSNAKNSQPFKPLSFKPAFNKNVKSKEIIPNSKKSVKNSEDKSRSTSDDLPDDQTSQIFDCNISHIEPRKSFAPKNFTFCAPIKLDISCFNIDGPSAIFSKEKFGRERTSTPLKEINQNSEQVKSLKTPLLKEPDQSLCTPLNNRDQSNGSTSSKKTNLRNFKLDSIGKINDVDVCQKQTLLNVDIKELKNISDKLTSERESVLEAINNKNSMNININPIEVNSFEKEQNYSKNDSPDFDKFLAEHGNESLDTFLTVPENSIKEKVSDLNLTETKLSKKSTGCLQTKSRPSLKPNLQSIRESSENKHNLETPKTSRISTRKIEFTPRRSARLAEKFKRSGSFESLLNVGRPSIMDSIDLDEPGSSAATGITYDFDSLHLEDTPIVKRKPKVSLLYTPITKSRPSTRKSIKGDLISFSPLE